MCGILGVLAFGELADKKQEKLRQEAMIFLSSELLQLTQPRGKDATGIATMFSNLDYMGLKMGIPSTDFVSRFGGTEKDFDGYLNIWRKKTAPAKMILGHCRKSSVGNPEDNANNHPIKVRDIVGVHNGTLTNHNRIFELLKCDRDGLVDSEAIFRLLYHFTNGGKEPFAPEAIQEVCRRLHGSYACLAFTGNNPYQMVGFRDARPMEVLLIKPLKLLLIASDKDFLKHAIFRYNKEANLYQTGVIKFPPVKKADIELESLPDDHLYLFDIRKEIETTSKIKDLYISEEISRVNKIWDVKLNTGFPYQSRNFQNSYTPKTNYQNKPEVKPKEDKDRLGMAWNKDTKLYQVAGVDHSEEYSNVEIDSINGEIVDIETEKVLVKSNVVSSSQKFDLTRVYKDVDFLVIDKKATIEELSAPTENLPALTDPVLNKPVLQIESETNSNRTEVVLETHPDALERAEIASRGLETFKTDQDVQDALEIEKKEHLESLFIHTLANRIKKFFYKKGWYDGYISRLHESEKVEDVSMAKRLLTRTNNKRKMAEKNIRIMKNIILVFSNITAEYGINNLDGISDVIINRSVSKACSNNIEISIDLIKNVFKPGDFKKIPILRKIMSSIESNKLESVEDIKEHSRKATDSVVTFDNKQFKKVNENEKITEGSIIR